MMEKAANERAELRSQLKAQCDLHKQRTEILQRSLEAAEAERKVLQETLRADEEAITKDALQRFDAMVKAQQAQQKIAGSSAATATPTTTSGANATEERNGGGAAALAGGTNDTAAGRGTNDMAAGRGANDTAASRSDGAALDAAAVPAGGANGTAVAVPTPAGVAKPEAAASRCGEWPSQPVFGCDRRNRNWVQLGNYTGDAACRALCGLRAGRDGELCCYVSTSAGCWMKPGSRAFRYGRAGGLSTTCS